MRRIGFFLMATTLIVAVQCLPQPDFPDRPIIKFNEIIFKDLTNEADSLILTIDFQDGDGNLGLDKDEIQSPYNDKFYFLWDDSQKEVIKVIADPDKNFAAWTVPPIRYSDRSSVAELDTLPPFVNPFSCTNWEVVPDYDTVYYQSNIFHHNIIVDFLIRQSNGEFEKFDWISEFNYPNCGISYDGRFPVLNNGSRAKPLEGEIRYGMTSVGFKALFSVKTMKLRITIIDRNQNMSNTVESPPFTLQEITVK